MIVYLARDTVGLTPMFEASTTIDKVRHVGGWWRSEEKATTKLLETLAVSLVRATVVTVPAYPVEDLDPSIEIALGIPDVPDGAFITKAKGVARTCLRCGHTACPHCEKWCDTCLDSEPDDGERQEGDWILWPDGSQKSHVACGAALECVYPDETDAECEARETGNNAAEEAAHQRFPHCGSFSATDDGRVWYGPPTDIDKIDDKALSDDERAVLRARTLVRYADEGRNDRSMRIDSDILRGLLHLVDRAGVRIGPYAQASTQLETSLRAILKPQELESIEAAARRRMDEASETIHEMRQAIADMSHAGCTGCLPTRHLWTQYQNAKQKYANPVTKDDTTP